MFSFRTLLSPLLGESSSSYTSDRRSGGSHGRGGGGPDVPGGGPGRRRPMGRLNTNTMNMSSCPSGGCGR
uniref:Uncharacterized protein n=1 Tax=Acrobeloides nanus TaxID=290746 RepID=A0A914EAH2_9BILA